MLTYSCREYVVMAVSPASSTLFDKIWAEHLVAEEDGEALLYVDLHLLHEVTSPQAFAGLAENSRQVRRPERTLALSDHNVPTSNQAAGVDAVADPEARAQLAKLIENSIAFGVERFDMGDIRNGIVHVVAPEQGRTLPGSIIVCGDSHTSTHGAFGAFAFGIGTSEIEHVLATQTLWARKPRNMRIRVEGTLDPAVTAKDLALAILQAIGVDGANGFAVEFAGPAVRALSMEGRMTLCNMSVEMGARAGLIAPDEATFAYLKGRPSSPKAVEWDHAVAHWRGLVSDVDAVFDREIVMDAADIVPMMTWGTTPSQAIAVDGQIPDPARHADPKLREAEQRALGYMDLTPGEVVADIRIDRAFIGSCTNSRIEDLRAAAAVVKGRKVADGVRAMVVPGSGLVRQQAEAEGLDKIMIAAGFDWREPGCSMCVGMNPDRLAPGERCASTSNRNFEHRQGQGGRTHLMSPAMVAASAITGRITDPRRLS